MGGVLVSIIWEHGRGGDLSFFGIYNHVRSIFVPMINNNYTNGIIVKGPKHSMLIYNES